MFLRHPFISPHLPSYYLPSTKSAAQKSLIEGLRFDLDEVKRVQSKEKLAWKGTILSAVVSKGNEESIITQGHGRALLEHLLCHEEASGVRGRKISQMGTFNTH
jgi:hypothetical protein